MTTVSIPEERVHQLNNDEVRKGAYVLYWMQQSQRAEFNHALEYAIQQANRLNQPVVVLFCLMRNYPEANLRHYTFMLEGLLETAQSLKKRGILLTLREGSPTDTVLKLGNKASLIVADRGYLRHQRAWRRAVAQKAGRLVIEVESDVIVPVETVSDKVEYGAYTIRKRLQKHAEHFLEELSETIPLIPSLNLQINGLDLDLGDIPALCKKLNLDTSVKPADRLFQGGTSRAKQLFGLFLQAKLANYQTNNNQPQEDSASHMGMYLHFGQISPLWLAMQTRGFPRDENTEAFMEQLLVRRELAINYVFYNQNYEKLEGLPAWAQETLKKHIGDKRENLYWLADFEEAGTHDPYWNACMTEMKITGYLHNYLRMYWGKKILEWSATPAEAWETTLYLNNKYFLDGRDANSFAGVAWIFGQHDRPWKERPIYGKVRCMTAGGLERKCDMSAYLKKVSEIIEVLS